MGYLIAQIILCLIVAFLLGLLLGWLVFGRRDHDANDIVAGEARASTDARARIVALERELAACRDSAPVATAAVAAPAPSTPPPAAPSVTGAAAGAAGMGLFGAAAERPVDDLKRISGIGPKIESQLAGIGVVTYRQIADFSADDIARVNDAIQVFQGRIEREDWVAQAQRLHREAYGDAD